MPDATQPRPSTAVGIAVLALAAVTYLHGLGSLHILGNGDEMVYAQITRATAMNGHWLPLKSEMADMVNTKPPLLTWQGLVSTDWARHWSLLALRWPSVVWTFLTAGLAGLIAWKIKERDVAAGLLAAAIYLAFFSTYRYGRPFLTNPPETFWMFLCFFLLLWWKPESFASRFLFPTLIGLCAGIALFAKSFAQLVPIGVGLAAWHLHEVRRPDGGRDWRRLFTRSLPGLVWTAVLALGVFALWFVLDPDPQAIWREFVVHENLGKMRDGQPSYLATLLWGRKSVWGYALSWFLNAGLLALPLLGTLLRAWQHRRESGDGERLLWIWAAALFLVFGLPSQRSGRYLLEAMPGIAAVMAIHWHRLLPSAFLTTLGGVGVILGLVTWLSVLLVRDVGAAAFPPWHWAILAGAAALVVLPLVDRRRLSACAVPATLAAFLVVSSFLTAFDPPRGAYPAEAIQAAKGRVVWAPQNFRCAAERNSFLLPGATIRPYDIAQGRPDPAVVGPDDLVIVAQTFEEPAPPGAIGSRIELADRQTLQQLWEMASGRVAELLFRRDWLVKPVPLSAQHLLRREAAVPQVADREAAGALGEALPCGVADQRRVAPCGRLPAERLVEQDLPRGAREQVFAANHLGDLHRMVVGHDGQFVGGEIVAPPDDEVAEVDAGRPTHGAAESVVKLDRAAVGHAESPGHATGRGGTAPVHGAEAHRKDRFGLRLGGRMGVGLLCLAGSRTGFSLSVL